MATILYIDDEPSVGLILEDTLTRSGHRMIAAKSEGEALQILTREHVDLIISDAGRPGLSGAEFGALLAREGFDLPLIMLTSDDDEDSSITTGFSFAASCMTFCRFALRSRAVGCSMYWMRS